MVALTLADGDTGLRREAGRRDHRRHASSRRPRRSSTPARSSAASPSPASCCASRTTWSRSGAPSTPRCSCPSAAAEWPCCCRTSASTARRSRTSRTRRSGVIPIMKLLEDSFSYANQLGARQGAGAVYLHAHHPDIFRFLDTKRENADEKIRIKTLSLGVVIPDITFELAKKNEDMYLFSPYDVERVYGMPFADISVTEKYYEMVDDAPDPQDQDQGARVLPDPRRAAVRVRLPVHHVRGHGEPGQPDRRQDHPLQPVLGDPAGVHAVGVQRRPVLQPQSARTSRATSAR